VKFGIVSDFEPLLDKMKSKIKELEERENKNLQLQEKTTKEII